MNKHKLLIVTIIIEFVLIIGTIIIFNPFLKLELIGNKVIIVSYKSAYVEPGYKASLFRKDLTSRVKVTGNVDVNKIGEYKIEYALEDESYNKKVTRIVKVVDLNKPTITLKGLETISLCGKEYVEEGFEALDDVDGDLTKEVITKRETDRIIYTVSDKSGNKSEVERKLVVDKESPVVTLNYSDIVTFKQGSKYVELGATAIDNCDGDVTSKIEIVSKVDTNKHEIFDVVYKVKDSFGNEGTATRKVKIFTDADLNKDYIEAVEGPTYIKDILIVNKKYSIPSSFEVKNTEAKKALETLQKAAKSAGYTIALKSGLRSYEEQKAVFDKYKRLYDQDYADQRAARPGHSEHQTGLAFDIGHANQGFGETKEGIWLRENCAKYGFIIRYPKYKEAITGYGYEPWHVRYVGTSVATEIMEKNITLEEYLGIYSLGE